MVSLLALPLRYRIGQNGPISGKAGEVVVAPYQEVISGDCVKVAYLNLRRQDGKPAAYGPYLDLDDDIWRKYGEGAPDPAGPGWEKSLREQCAWAVAKGFTLVELDNCDTYTIEVTLRAYDIALSYGLSVLAKNPDIISGRAIIRHRAVVGIIIEDGWGTPGSAVALRDLEGKPSIPIWFVFFGGARATADAVADMVKINRYLNVGVTFDSNSEEYGGDIVDLALPSIQTQINVEPSMAWRLAKSLVTLRDQVNAQWPNRDKSSDGTIGDAAHAATNSDHNPNSADVVTAMDITNDPNVGLVARSLAEALVASRDPRIKYIISNAQIISSVQTPWVWRPYSGSNAHRAHVHISVMADPALYDDARPWALGAVTQSTQPPQVRPNARRFTNIEATMFGGAGDPNLSAYDEHFITDQEFGVALPFRFEPPSSRPRVRVWKDGVAVVCDIVDVGPWNNRPGDPYWLTGARPLVETQFANRTPAQNGRIPTNKAAIDLTPAAAFAIGLGGKGLVDWEFVGAEPEFIPPQKPTGPQMPPDAPTPFNAQVEDAIDEIRPILAKRFAALASGAPTAEQVQDDIIRRLGGTPPARTGPKQLPPPSSTTGGAPAPAPKSGGSLAGFAGGSVISGIIAGLMGGDVVGTPFGMGADPTLGGTISGIAGLLSPILGYAGAGSGILNAIRAIGPAVRAFSGALSGNKAQ